MPWISAIVWLLAYALNLAWRQTDTGRSVSVLGTMFKLAISRPLLLERYLGFVLLAAVLCGGASSKPRGDALLEGQAVLSIRSPTDHDPSARETAQDGRDVMADENLSVTIRLSSANADIVAHRISADFRNVPLQTSKTGLAASH